MTCRECGHENLIKARYCSSCGTMFTEEERKAAWDATFWGKLDRLKEAKQWITLEKVTGNWIFRILVLAAIVVFGLIAGGSKGSSMMILESDDYAVRYNAELGEYYVFTEKDEVDLNLYLPGKPEGVKVTSVTLDSDELSEREYAVGDTITLERSAEVMYRIVGEYGEEEKDIDLIVYDMSALPE